MKYLKKNYLAKKSSLTDWKISGKECEHVFNVWNKFEMKTMKGYLDLFLKCDVLSLATNLIKFRNKSVKNYGLCPSHSLSTPSLSWDTMLKMTKLNWNLFQILTCIYSLREVQEMNFFTFLIDTANLTINI